jgi:predicted RNase H-like HicB family nuclease
MEFEVREDGHESPLGGTFSRWRGDCSGGTGVAGKEGEDYIVRRSAMMTLKVVLEPSDEGGYTVTVPALLGCISEGDTREEALKNIREAIQLYLEPIEEDLSFAPDAEVLEIAV